MADKQFTLVNWNVEWLTPRSARFAAARQRMLEPAPDVICLTEARASVLPENGHLVASDADYGYVGSQPDRRKVVLWSREAWENVDRVGDPGLPIGRFGTGITTTHIGPVLVVNVCNPWPDAHVRTGRRDRQSREDHVLYLDGLARVLAAPTDEIPTLVVGHFNQWIPRTRVPLAVYQKLVETFSRWSVVTTGTMAEIDPQAIDHVALDARLQAAMVASFSRCCEDDTRPSDHHGVVVSVASADSD